MQQHTSFTKKRRPNNLKQYPVATHYPLPTMYNVCSFPQTYGGGIYNSPNQYLHPLLPMVATSPTHVSPMGWFPVPYYIPQITPLSLQPLLHHPFQETLALNGGHGNQMPQPMGLQHNYFNNDNDSSDEDKQTFAKQQQHQKQKQRQQQQQQQQQRTIKGNNTKLTQQASQQIVDELLLQSLFSIMAEENIRHTANGGEEIPVIDKLMNEVDDDDESVKHKDSVSVNRTLATLRFSTSMLVDGT